MNARDHVSEKMTEEENEKYMNEPEPKNTSMSWREYRRYISEEYYAGCGMTCAEAESLADFYNR